MDNSIFFAKKIKLFNIFWLFFIIELAIFFIITYYYIAPDILQQSKVDSHIIVLYFSYLTTIISIPLIYRIYKNGKKKIKKEDSVKLKLEKYMFLKLIKYAILEFTAVFSLIAFYLNEIEAPLYMFGIVFVAALLNKPTLKQFSNDFINIKDENDIEEIVYMPDEVKKMTEEKNKDNSV